MEEYYKKLMIFLDEYNEHSDEELDECEHDIIDVEGVSTCKKCGSMLKSYFVKEMEIIPTEIRILQSNKYSKLKHLKKKLIYHSVKKINITPDYKKCYYNLIKSLPPKTIKKALIGSSIDPKYFYAYLLDCEKESLTRNQIDTIFEICEKFIKLKLVNNINNKALIFVIARREYNISLFSYSGVIHKNVIEKYELLYSEFLKKNK